MATAAADRATDAAQRFVFYDVGWGGYQTLLSMVGDRPVRVTYDRGDVELVAPLPIHERYKYRLGRMIDEVTTELGIPVVAVASSTFHREDVDRGLEADQAYYLANAARVYGRERISLDADPPPDLVVEIDITSSSLDRMAVYAALRVPEVWRFDGGSFDVFLLQRDGTYGRSETSAAFPFLPMRAFAGFLLGHDLTDDTAWARAFRAWVRGEIVARFGGAGGAPER